MSMKPVLKGAFRDMVMKRVLGIILILIMMPIAQSEIDEYVSTPKNIPDFHNFMTPQLEPGENGIFSFEVSNRYNESITNTTIIAEIYHRADIDESEEFTRIPSKERPYISEMKWEINGKSETKTTADTKSASFEVGNINVNETVSLEFKINTKVDTKEGTYFVRFSMNFDHNETARSMESRGHWSMELWENATTYESSNYPGNINLDTLEVDGIIPDSSFGVKKPIPKWPLYILITLTVLFASLSVIFYLEEEGTYPKLNKWLQKQRGKLNEFRLLFKYRKGRQ